MSERGTEASADQAPDYDYRDPIEEKLRFALEELRRVTARAERAEKALEDSKAYAGKLERAALDHSRFLSALAHVLRNPLAPIRSASYVVRRNPADTQAVLKADAMVERQVSKLSSIADDLSDLGRAQRKEIELRPTRVDLHELFSAISREIEPLLALKAQRLTVRWLGGPYAVRGDRALLERIFRAVALGSASSLPDCSEVPIEISAAGGRASIAAPDVEHSSERPHREHATVLSLAFELLKLHSGSFSVEEKGLRIDLPLFASGESDGPDRSGPSADRGSESSPSSVGISVLVIEDNRDSAEALANCLSVMGYDVHVAYDSAQGLRLAEAKRPAVVICDIGLPDLDGYEVAKRLRRSPATEKSALIALTGYGLEDDKALSLKAGFDHHLIKPLGIEELETLMQRVTLAGRA